MYRCLTDYKETLRLKLNNMQFQKMFCCVVMLCAVTIITLTVSNANQITDACIRSADSTIPCTKLRGSRGNIPGWTEIVAPAREASIFWHNMWIACGRPHTDIVSDIMRKTRLQYHAAKQESDIVNSRECQDCQQI